MLIVDKTPIARRTGSAPAASVDLAGAGSAPQIDLADGPPGAADAPPRFQVPAWLLSFCFHVGAIVTLVVVAAGPQRPLPTIIEATAASQSEDDHQLSLMAESPSLVDDLEANLQSVAAQDALQSVAKYVSIDTERAGMRPVGGGRDAENRLGQSLFDSLSTPGDLMEYVPGREPEGAAPAARFYGIKARGKKFVFIIDRSGSMDQDGRWITARHELIKSIEQLDKRQKFFVLLYSTKWEPMMGRRGKRLKLVEATEANKKLAIKWLNKQQPGGYTFPKKSVDMAMQLEPDAIFLLSDGEFMDDTVEVLRAHAEGLEDLPESYHVKPLVIHTVALHSPIGAEGLKLIARWYRGSFRFIP